MRCTSQREGCIACMSLWWPFFVPTGNMQIASGLEQDRSSSAESFGRSHWGKVLLATCAGKTRLCWAIRVSLLIPAKMMFSPKSPWFKVLMMSLEQCYIFQSPCFELKHSDSQKAYGFGCLANDTTVEQTRWISGSAVEVGHFLSVKSTRSKFHDTPFLRYIDSCIAPKRIASCKIHGGEQSLPIVIVIWVGISISKSVMLAHVSF